jgi:predicted membrane protein
MKKEYATIEGWILILLAIIQVMFITLKLTHTLFWSWLLIMIPILFIIFVLVMTVIIAVIHGMIVAYKQIRRSKLYRVSKLPKPIVDGFLKGYIDYELEEQLKNFPDRKDLN